MAILNVTQAEEEVTEIQWCPNSDFNLVPCLSAVTVSEAGLSEMYDGATPLLESKEEAENLIKAIRKAIDLGWFQ